MEILRFFPGGQMPQPLARIDAPPPDGFVWIDFQRESDAGWPVEVERISGVTIDPAHVRDAMNTEDRKTTRLNSSH